MSNKIKNVLEKIYPQMWIFWLQIYFWNFQSSKSKLKKDHLKFQRSKNHYKGQINNVFYYYYKIDPPPNVGILKPPKYQNNINCGTKDIN